MFSSFLNKNVLFISKCISVFIFCIFENLVILYFVILFLINENKRRPPKVSVIFRKKINIRPCLIFGETRCSHHIICKDKTVLVYFTARAVLNAGTGAVQYFLKKSV